MLTSLLAELTPEAKLERRIDKFFKRAAVPTSALVGVLAELGQFYAEQVHEAVAVFAYEEAVHSIALADRMRPLIHMLQDIAMPIGITVSLWGLIEVMMGNIESGKSKLKWAIIGFIGMFLIPEVFYAIRDAFQR
ncbi:hypothetical protein D3C81_1627880 [compost metagenome]